jgi:hypothetical protein
MKTKFYSLILLLSISIFSIQLEAQVPNPVRVSGCFQKLTTGQFINIKCGNCCEYNSQANNPNTVTHKCITPADPNCTGNFISGKCPKCILIIYKEPTTRFPIFHAIIYAPLINKKWYFDPNSPNTTKSINEFEEIINFIPLDGNLEGEDMTSADFELLNNINP